MGGEVFQRSFKALAPFGRLVSFGSASGDAATLDARDLYGDNQTLTCFLLSGWSRHGGKTVSSALTQLLTWVAQGEPMVPDLTSFPLERERGDPGPADDRQGRPGALIVTAFGKVESDF